MAGPYVITPPVMGQPIPPVGFGVAVKTAIEDLDARSSVLETGAQAVVARGRRVTSTAAITTTEVGVLRIDNIPVQAGKIYRISTSNINMDGSVANDIATCRFRLGFGVAPGTIATTASTFLGYIRVVQDDASQSNVVSAQTFYVATQDGYISVMLTCVRQGGTGNIVVFCSTGADSLDLTVEYGGDDPGDTGVTI